MTHKNHELALPFDEGLRAALHSYGRRLKVWAKIIFFGVFVLGAIYLATSISQVVAAVVEIVATVMILWLLKGYLSAILQESRKLPELTQRQDDGTQSPVAGIVSEKISQPSNPNAAGFVTTAAQPQQPKV